MYYILIIAIIILFTITIIWQIRNKEKLKINIYRISKWKPKFNDVYYYISDIGEINRTEIKTKDDLLKAIKRICCGNCFLTKQNAMIVSNRLYNLLSNGYIKTFSERKWYE